MRRGYVQIYTGNGKGKTTAALGLAVRAAGAGLRVFFAQFIKQKKCSEHAALERFDDFITIQQFGRGFLLGKKPAAGDIAAAQQGMAAVRQAITSGEYDLVILDEANVAVHYGLISVEDLLELIAAKPARVELVITGRYADRNLIKAADLVTEMHDVKHYSGKGVSARRGIEK